jgi:hypothetical protein
MVVVGAGSTAALAGTFTELVVVRSGFPPLLLIQQLSMGGGQFTFFLSRA